MKLALFGASGRMGRSIARLAKLESDLILAEAIAHPASSSLGIEVEGLAILPAFQNRADLLIDVSLAAAFPTPLHAALTAKKPIVIGVTGLKAAQLLEIEQAALQIPVFYAPNFSVGMAVFRKLAVQAARAFFGTADLVEKHHAQKKDAPSGSALMIADELRKIGVEPRIHSIRSGKIVAEHSLLLNSDEERIEIAHTAHSRDVFARGAIAAARFLSDKKPGLYGMDDLVL